MRITILVNMFPPKWRAGTEIATYHLAEKLAERGHEIHVITSYDEGIPYLEQIQKFGIHRISFPKIRIIGFLILWFKFFLQIRIIKPEIVHAQDFNMGVPAYIAKKFLKIPYIVWGRGDDVYRPQTLMRMPTKLLIRNADAVIALTNNMRKKLKAICERAIFVIPNAINLTNFHEKNTHFTVIQGKMDILFVGSLSPVKGVQYLIRAMQGIHTVMPEVSLMLVGDGSEREYLEDLTETLDLQNCIKFFGSVPHQNIPEYMYKADVFVLPSLSEGFPNVCLEAMACGLPIVATNVGGIPDIIEDGVNGYLINPKNPDELREILLFLLNNDELRKKISDNNREKVKNYSWERILTFLEAVYFQVKKSTA